MINTKQDLKRIICVEKALYFKTNKQFSFARITKDVTYRIYKYQVLLRKCEYYHNTNKKFRYLYNRRKKNCLGIKLGIEIWENCFEEGLIIYHAGNIVVNGNCKIGKNCSLYGSNCIGNNGKDQFVPNIGNNVKIGVGAKIIGNVVIANDVFIAAGAVVISSVNEAGATVAGIPAKVVRRV